MRSPLNYLHHLHWVIPHHHMRTPFTLGYTFSSTTITIICVHNLHDLHHLHWGIPLIRHYPHPSSPAYTIHTIYTRVYLLINHHHNQIRTPFTPFTLGYTPSSGTTTTCAHHLHYLHWGTDLSYNYHHHTRTPFTPFSPFTLG